VLDAYPESVSMIDRSSKLYPYQLATIDASSAFELLRLNPTTLERHAARRKTRGNDEAMVIDSSNNSSCNSNKKARVN